MSDAPERIWAFKTGLQPSDGSAGVWANGADASIGAVEYVRADLGSFYQEKDIDALMNERDRLREALERVEIASDHYAAITEAETTFDAIRYAHESTARLARAALHNGDDERHWSPLTPTRCASSTASWRRCGARSRRCGRQWRPTNGAASRTRRRATV